MKEDPGDGQVEASGWEEMLQRKGSGRFLVQSRVNEKLPEPRDLEITKVTSCLMHNMLDKCSLSPPGWEHRQDGAGGGVTERGQG